MPEPTMPPPLPPRTIPPLVLDPQPGVAATQPRTPLNSQTKALLAIVVALFGGTGYGVVNISEIADAARRADGNVLLLQSQVADLRDDVKDLKQEKVLSREALAKLQQSNENLTKSVDRLHSRSRRRQ